MTAPIRRIKSLLSVNTHCIASAFDNIEVVGAVPAKLDGVDEAVLFIPAGSAPTVDNDNNVTGLPPPEDGTAYLVAARVAGANHNRPDLIAYDHTKAIRKPAPEVGVLAQGGIVYVKQA